MKHKINHKNSLLIGLDKVYGLNTVMHVLSIIVMIVRLFKVKLYYNLYIVHMSVLF